MPRARRLQLTPQLGLPGEKRIPRVTLGKAFFRPHARWSWIDPFRFPQNGVTELDDLVAFVAQGLLDPRAGPKGLRMLVPKTQPSGRRPLTFEFGR